MLEEIRKCHVTWNIPPVASCASLLILQGIAVTLRTTCMKKEIRVKNHTDYIKHPQNPCT